MRSYLILAMCGLFLIQYFVQARWLEVPLTILTLAAILGSAGKAAPVLRWFGISMLVLGIWLDFQKGRGIEGVSEGLLMNLPLLSLVVLVPLLSIPLKLGGYFDAIHSLLLRLKRKPRRLFAGITSVLFVLGPILNLGSIRIVDDLLKGLRLPPMMMAKSYLEGFSLTMLWSPYYASMALVLYYLKIPTVEYIKFGVGLALLFFLVANLLFAFWARRYSAASDGLAEERTEPEAAGAENGSYRSKLIRLGLMVVTLMSATLLLEAAIHWSMMVIICLLAIAFPLIWGIFMKEKRRLVAYLIDFRDNSVPMMNNEIVLFTSAGLLGNAMLGTSLGSGIQALLSGLAHRSFLLFAVTVLVVIVGVTFVGIHQMVIVTALVTQMDAHELGSSKQALALLLMLAWSISSVLSPVNPLNLMVGRLSGLSGVQAGLRANGLYLLVVAFLGLCVIMMIH